MKIVTNQKGHSLIEVVVCLHFFLLMIIGLFSISFFLYGKVNLQIALHEGIVCSIREQNTHRCKRWVKQRLNKVMFFGKLKSLRIYRQNNYQKGFIAWQYSNKLKKLNIVHSYKLRNTLIKPTKRDFF